MPSPIRILCVGAGHMGRSHALAYHRIPGFEICGIVTRSPESRAALNAELGGGYAGVRRFPRSPARPPSPTRFPSPPIRTPTPTTPKPPSTPAAMSSSKNRSPRPSPPPNASSPRPVPTATQTGHRLHPPPPPELDQIHRNRPDPRQAAGDADEPQPAILRRQLADPQEPDVVDLADRRLRRPLRRCDVPDDPLEAGPRVRHRCAPHRRTARGKDQLRPAPGHLRGRLGRLV